MLIYQLSSSNNNNNNSNHIRRNLVISHLELISKARRTEVNVPHLVGKVEVKEFREVTISPYR